MKRLFILFVWALLLSQASLAQIPQTISYQGVLKDTDGAVVDDGTYSMTFKLYRSSISTTVYWSEEQTVSVANGIFSVILGSVNPIDITFDRQYWLGISVNEGDELTPRIQLTSSAYSLHAQTVEDDAITDSKIANDTVVKSVNGIKDQVVLMGGTNIDITKSGNSITISSDYEGGLTLPYSGFTFSNDDAFGVSAYGDGKAGSFWIINEGSYSNALMVGSTGKGSAINIGTTGTSSAGFFSIQNESNSAYALGAYTDGSGPAFSGSTSGTSYAGLFFIDNINNDSSAISASTNGGGQAGFFYGSGSTSKGILVSVPSGNTGLYVSGGTKNAIVATSQGARKLYTEESTEVWFTDYGFGTLNNGVTKIEMDALYVETVSLTEPYHVFVQPYGNASLYVTDRTSSSFIVKSSDSSSIEFSYRIVARRKGYEQARLEHEPMGDDDPNLYPSAKKTTFTDRYKAESIKNKQLFEKEYQKRKID